MKKISTEISDKILDQTYNDQPEFDTTNVVIMNKAWEETRTLLSSRGLPFVALGYPYTTSLFLLVLHPDFNVPNPNSIGNKNNQIGLEIIQRILMEDTSSLAWLGNQSIQRLRTASNTVVAAMKRVLVTMTATREWLEFQDKNNLDQNEILQKVNKGAMFVFLKIAEPNLQTIQTLLCRNMDADFPINLMEKDKQRLEQAVLGYELEASGRSQDGEEKAENKEDEKAEHDKGGKAEYDEKSNQKDQNMRTLESLKIMLMECSSISDRPPATQWTNFLHTPKSAPIPAQSSLNFLGIMAQLIENDKNSSAQNDSALLPNDEDAWDKVVNQYNSAHKNKLLEIPKGYHNLIIVLMSTLFWVNSLHQLRAKPGQRGQPEQEEVSGATQSIISGKIAELANNIWKGSVRASIIHKNRDDYRAIIPVRVTDRTKTDGGAQMIVVFNAPVFVAYSQLEELFDAKHSTGSLQASLAINPGREAFGSILRPVRNVQWAAGQVAGAMQSLNPYRLKWSKETNRIATNILTSGVGGILAAGAMYTAASDSTPQVYRHIY